MIIDLIPKLFDGRRQVGAKRLVFVVFWTLLFTLAYAQSPLFTSNQNQYFIHGLANAGYGDLEQDWLANTLDPTPVFSGLVALTYRLIPWPPLYYLEFTLLAGIYLFSLSSILSQVFNLQDSLPKRWLSLLGLLLLHSAVLRYLVGRLLGQDWAYLFDGGAAGQRLLGDVLQPSTFGVFLLLSIAFYLRGNLLGTLISLVIAPTFHPTYLLSAATLTLVYMGLEYRKGKRISQPLLLGAVALLGVSPVLASTFRTFGGTDPLLAERARQLLVEFRIPHHALPAVWFDGAVVVKVIFVILALILARRHRLFHFLLWPFLVAVLGTAAQVVSGSEVLALLFPWRTSTWVVPLSSGVILIWGLEKALPWIQKSFSTPVIYTMTVIAALSLAGAGLAKSLWDYGERIRGDDRAILAQIQQARQPGEVYLVPLDMQDFRLETGASAYVEFKSIPYKDTDVLEWYRRVSLAGNLYRAPYKRSGCQLVAELAEEGITHIILPYDHALQKCENLKRGYWDWNYVLYRVRDEGMEIED